MAEDLQGQSKSKMVYNVGETDNAAFAAIQAAVTAAPSAKSSSLISRAANNLLDMVPCMQPQVRY